ncbi:hypothetical protein LBMAG56_39530 [Verrucomicrobiota bacterium]|nr:hypothetical protein LBMAG56_39530 [Verrucomicrobiota bacterium]
MGKVRRGGYIIVWWAGDHEPRHVHVKTSSGRKLGRLDITAMQGLEGWLPDRKLIEVIQQLKTEGRL